MLPRITTKLSVSTAAAVNADLYLLSPNMFNIIFSPAISRYKHYLRLKCLSLNLTAKNNLKILVHIKKNHQLK